PDDDRAPVRFFLSGDHAKQRRFPGAVRADDADDRTGGHAEGEIVDEEALAVALGDAFELDHRIPQTIRDRDENFLRLVALLVFVGGQLLEAREARLRFRLAALGVLPHPFELLLHRLDASLLLLLLDLEALFLLLEPGGVVAFQGMPLPPASSRIHWAAVSRKLRSG